jgi:DNA-binding transcriptional LysR family regulator
MYLEHLTTFVNLAETLNFSKTAVNLNISQSSVSQAIASIEKQLGVTLFYRSRKAVSLTPAGQEFYDRVKPWLNEYNKGRAACPAGAKRAKDEPNNWLQRDAV